MTLHEILWWRGLRKRSIGQQTFRGGIQGWDWLRPHVAWLYDLGFIAFAYRWEYDSLTLYFRERKD